MWCFSCSVFKMWVYDIWKLLHSAFIYVTQHVPYFFTLTAKSHAFVKILIAFNRLYNILLFCFAYWLIHVFLLRLCRKPSPSRWLGGSVGAVCWALLAAEKCRNSQQTVSVSCPPPHCQILNTEKILLKPGSVCRYFCRDLKQKTTEQRQLTLQ